jgi:alkylation response protein AidB-like acyl-CoA dehydrogenase
MHFAFSDQQDEFREAVRQVLAKESTTDHLRVAYRSPSARTARWATLAEMGVVGLSVPGAHGGLGLGLVDLVALLEEAGRVALPEPLLETTALVAPLLAELAGDPDGDGRRSARMDSWLAGIASGAVTGAVGPVPTGDPPLAIAGADGADLLVLYSYSSGVGDGAGDGGDGPVGGADGADGAEIHVVDSATVTVRAVSSLDPTRRLGVPHWRATEDTLVASGPSAAGAIRRLTDRAAVSTGAELLGLTGRMITLAADYAKVRRQFGAPIGSFQAVKHLLAGAQVALEFARPVVYAAAWAIDEGLPHASRSASTAKALASEAALEAARVSLQVHGAIGYTWECDLHLFLKRAWALSEAWGSAAHHRMLVLDSLVAGGAPEA